jgi:hypothetical protein
MKAWTSKALAVALALCAAAASAQTGSSGGAGTSAATPATPAGATTQRDSEPGSQTDKDVEAACAGTAGADRTDCMKNMTRAMAECGRMSDTTARSDCVRSARLKGGNQPSAGGSPAPVNQSGAPPSGAAGHGAGGPGSNVIKAPAMK